MLRSSFQAESVKVVTGATQAVAVQQQARRWSSNVEEIVCLVFAQFADPSLLTCRRAECMFCSAQQQSMIESVRY